ncbi:MAG: NUDIX domain-containing protein [Patescibacteria group bacterium]
MPKKTAEHPSKQNIKLAVDNCIFTVNNGELYILLIQMKKKPFTDVWALPGGLVRKREELDAAAKRILHEETNVQNIYLEQLYTFGKISRDPFGRVISVAYLALIPSEKIILKTLPKYADVRWWKFSAPAERGHGNAQRSELPRLAYDHNEIAVYAKQRLKWKLEYTNAAWSLLPERFTLTDLQKVYETILGRKMDKRNFRKKILSLGLLEEAGRKIARGAYRTATSYRFKSRKPKIVEILS